MMEDALIKELSKLSKNEKLLLVEALWDSIASEPDQVEVPDHHKKNLAERLKTLEGEKANASFWDEVWKKYL